MILNDCYICVDEWWILRFMVGFIIGLDFE